MALKVTRFTDSEREGIKTGDLVYVSYGGKVGKFLGTTPEGYWKVKGKFVIRYNKEFIRKPTEAEIKKYQAEQAAAKRLKERQNELKDLKFKSYIGVLWKEEKEVLQEAGYYVYDLRNWDEGNGYNIEPHVTINNIGNMVTNIDLKPYMNETSWIGSDELEKVEMEDLYPEIRALLMKGSDLHVERNTQAAN